MVADVSMDYAVVEAMAEGFQTTADTLGAVNQSLEVAIAVLHASAFLGMVGNLALAHYLEGIQPNVARLASTCEEMSLDLIGAIIALRDGDYSGSQRFIDGGGAVRFAAGGGNGGGADASKQARSTASYANPTNYQDGQNGWELINMNGSFTPGELLDQGNTPSCTLYGAMNLLVENGYDISQDEADAIYRTQLGNHLEGNILENWRMMRDLADGTHDDVGFPRRDALAILSGYGVDYTHGDFDTGLFGWGSPDRQAAEQFLIDQLEAGNPVYVSTACDDTFGDADSSHAYTVIGVQTDENGHLTHVLVSTNWGGGQAVAELPADAFMDDWINHNNGEYVIINH